MSALATTSAVDEIAALGNEINANHYKIVCLAARYDTDLEWHAQGLKSPSHGIAQALDIHTSTAREWIRVGHALDVLPAINDAFASNELSYAKTRIVTRWADPSNEHELLELAWERSANRLTTAIAKYLADDETDVERDLRLHDHRSVTVHTDGDGMIVVRAVLPPDIGKRVVAAFDTIVQQVAVTPVDEPDASADASDVRNASADASADQSMSAQLRELKQRWQPKDAADDRCMPSFAQQRADAFVLLFLGKNIESKPIDASNRRRHPTPRQKRVVMETHNHECVDCQSTDLLELDHNPPHHQTKHTITTELEPRCAPCHRARHLSERCAQGYSL